MRCCVGLFLWFLDASGCPMAWGSINNTVNTRSARLWFGDIVFFCSLQDRILLFDIQLLKRFSFFFSPKISEEKRTIVNQSWD